MLELHAELFSGPGLVESGADPLTPICPRLHSPRRFLVDIVTAADREGKTQALADAYSASALKAANDAHLDELRAAGAVAAVGAGVASKGILASASRLGLAILGSSASAPAAPGVAGSKAARLSDPSSEPSAVDDGRGSDGSAGDAALSRQRTELSTRSSTATPWWWALLVLLRYRARVDYKNPEWVVPRMADKFLFAFIILTLYLKSGDDYGQSNLVNLGASLFMWTTLPAFGAVAFVPSIVLGECV
jgi:ATP-binding cassette, subfamily G (WHITE), member 2